MARMKVATKTKPKASTPPRMIMKRSTGGSITISRSPRVTSHSGDGQVWTESDRAGRRAVMRRTAEKVPTFSFSLVLAYQDWKKPVSWQLRKFADYARSKQPMSIIYSQEESGLFYITDFTYEVELRSPTTNEPTRVNLDFTLTRASKDSIRVGPTKKKKAPPKKKKKTPAKKKAVRKHKIKKGDTLWDLAQKYYKNPLKWRMIADKNKITNPRTLRIGRVITIP